MTSKIETKKHNFFKSEGKFGFIENEEKYQPGYVNIGGSPNRPFFFYSYAPSYLEPQSTFDTTPTLKK